MQLVKLFLLILSAVIFAKPAVAAIIDFETLPGGTPADKVAISDQYLATDGVSFALSNGGTPFLEQTGGGDSGNGFSNDQRSFQPDVEAVGHEGELGNFFLRFGTVSLFNAPVPELIITYAGSVGAASGQIWDIDGTAALGSEQWLVTAFDATDAVVGTQLSPAHMTFGPSSLDGLPWNWSFDLGSDVIASIRIAFVGTKTENIGLAFDNFSPNTAAVPVPAAIWCFIAALLTLVRVKGAGLISR